VDFAEGGGGGPGMAEEGLGVLGSNTAVKVAPLGGRAPSAGAGCSGSSESPSGGRGGGWDQTVGFAGLITHTDPGTVLLGLGFLGLPLLSFSVARNLHMFDE
jgi:hypothetical protein